MALATLVVVTARSGGREAEVVLLAIALCLPAVLLTRPWRTLPAWLLLLLALLPTTAIAVSFLAPTQFGYPRDLVVWPYAALLAVAVASYSRSTARRLAILLLLCVLGFYEFFQALVPWVASDNPAKAMVGTFYQQDMYGGFCAAIAVIALALAVLGAGVGRLVGMLVGPVCAVGTVLSTSRAAIGILLLGFLVLALLAVRSPRRWQALGIWSAAAASSVALLFSLTSTWVFPDSGGGSPVAGMTGRSGSDSLGSSSSIRQAYWSAAVEQFTDAPLVGQGFGSFGLTFYERAPLGAFGSQYAHNGVLQGLGEGGLLFGLPLLVVSVLILLGCSWIVLRGLGREPADAVRVAAGLGALAFLGHSLVDFDWTFPALAGLLAVAAAICVGPRSGQKAPNQRAAGGLVSILVLSTAFSAYAVHQSPDVDDLPAAEMVYEAQQADGLLRPNPVLWSEVLRLAGSGRALDVDLRKAVDRTARLGRIDPIVQMLRAQVLVELGRVEEGLELARTTTEATRDSRPDLAAVHARLLTLTGDRPGAVRLLSAAIEERARPGFPVPADVWSLVHSLQDIAGREDPDAACGYLQTLRAFGSETRPPYVLSPSRVPVC